MGGSRTGNPVLELKDQPTQGGGFGENSRESGNPGNGDGSRKRNGAGSEKQRGTGDKAGKKISHDYARTLGRLIESQVRFTKQLENSRMAYQKQKTLQEMEAKEARRAYRIVSFSLSRLKAVGGELVKAVRFLASKGKGYLILLLVPVIAGVSYEFIRLAGRSENPVVGLLSKPGLWMQKLTTKEPDDDMIRVGIASVEAVFDWRDYLRREFGVQTEAPEEARTA